MCIYTCTSHSNNHSITLIHICHSIPAVKYIRCVCRATSHKPDYAITLIHIHHSITAVKYITIKRQTTMRAMIVCHYPLLLPPAPLSPPPPPSPTAAMRGPWVAPLPSRTTHVTTWHARCAADIQQTCA